MRTDKSLAPEHDSGATSGAASAPGPPVIEVKVAQVDVLRQAAGWSYAELARRSRLDQSAVARLLRGDVRPGNRSIGGMLLAFSTAFPNIGFYDLFELISEDGTSLAPRVHAAESERDGAVNSGTNSKVARSA